MFIAFSIVTAKGKTVKFDDFDLVGSYSSRSKAEKAVKNKISDIYSYDIRNWKKIGFPNADLKKGDNYIIYPDGAVERFYIEEDFKVE